jgi:hypothetical protein
MVAGWQGRQWYADTADADDVPTGNPRALATVSEQQRPVGAQFAYAAAEFRAISSVNCEKASARFLGRPSRVAKSESER